MSKINIQNQQGETIVGILEKKDLVEEHTQLVLITHGVLGTIAEKKNNNFFYTNMLNRT